MTLPAALPTRLAFYLAAVQCLATVTWIAYVVYLPQLAASAGVPASAVGWILLADQAVFALADLALGRAADRALRVLRTLGFWLIAITVVSGAALVAVPMIAGAGAPRLFLALIFFWALTSSVLRAPALALVAKRTPKPALPWLATLVVIGTALAAAAAPYLALITKEVDPQWPFLLATLTLLAAVVGLALAERQGAPPDRGSVTASDEAPAVAPANQAVVAAFFAAAALLAVGLQIHTNINTAPRYKQFASADALPWLLPVFAVGTSLLAFAGGRASQRAGPLAALSWAALIGAVFCAGAAAAPGLVPLTLAQFLAGGAWGAINSVLLAYALTLGKPGREGAMAGRLTALLAAAALLRLGLVNLQIPSLPPMAAVLPWLPALCWAGAALVLWRARSAARGA